MKACEIRSVDREIRHGTATAADHRCSYDVACASTVCSYDVTYASTPLRARLRRYVYAYVNFSLPKKSSSYTVTLWRYRMPLESFVLVLLFGSALSLNQREFAVLWHLFAIANPHEYPFRKTAKYEVNYSVVHCC